MKQRFSSLDIRVIAHELHESLVSLRVSNIYDLSSKILLVKFAKQDNKKQLIIDSGFRCHLTDFVRTTAASPSQFVARLRKSLKTRRVTSVAQIGTDRILEFQFSDGLYRLYLEFFAGGNVVLTDHDLKILALLRNVPEGEGREPQRVGLTYNLGDRQNFAGIPPLTKERIRNALSTALDKAVTPAEDRAAKKKTKAGDELRKSLATTITELPPVLVEHAFSVTGFDPATKPSDILENDSLLDSLLHTLIEARKIVDEVSNTAKCTGYIIAKQMPGKEGASEKIPQPASTRQDLLYDDFHPFLPQKFANNPSITVLTFEGFNKTVDEFFSSLEGQKLESRLNQRESAAQRKLEAARQDQAKRIEGLQEVQSLNLRKAAAIEVNVDRVQEAMDAVNGLLEQGMDWYNVGKLVEREQQKNNPVASIIKLPLKIEENIITLLLGEEELDDPEDEASETDSDSDNEDAETEISKRKVADTRLAVDINLSLTPWSNAREYYGERKEAAEKEQRTAQQNTIALRNAEQKIAADLKKGLKQEKAVLQPLRTPMWFEKFVWFISSDGYLVLGGKDASQNEMLYKRHLRKGDVYCHADLNGAAVVVIKNNPSTPDAPIPPSTLSQAGSLSVCSSTAWDSKAGMAGWWVNAEQVSKSTPSGDFLPVGSFNIRGEKNYLPPAQLLIGFGVMFKISDQSKASHVKHRVLEPTQNSAEKPEESASTATEVDATQESEVANDSLLDNQGGGESDGEDITDNEDDPPPENPLQGTVLNNLDEPEQSLPQDELAEDIVDLSITDSPQGNPSYLGTDDQLDSHKEGGPAKTSEKLSAPSTANSAGKGPTKRGQRAKAKKLAKYKDQDEEDRLAAEALIGSAAGRQKAEAEAQAKAQRDAEAAAAKERRRAQHERRQKETAAHEEARRAMLQDGAEAVDADELEAASLDSLVGTPLPGDEILEAVPVCAPWNAMGKFKYKAKMQPGAVKKGKAVKEVLERWKADAEKKGSVDEHSRDKERMWPREVELIKALRPEEVVNCVPVSKVRVMMSGGGESSKGSGGRGGKGPKRK